MNRIEVIDSEHWHKSFDLLKDIVHIGNGRGNDIALLDRSGTRAIPWRIQLIALPKQPPAYRLVNLGDATITFGVQGGQSLPPRALLEVGDNAHLYVGDYHLILHCGDAVFVPSGDEQTESPSKSIGMKLILPEKQLLPERPLEGSVVVYNLGDSEQGAQFRLDLQGLTSDYYELGAGPLLFPGAHKEVFFRLFHSHRPEPQAGNHQFHIIATADAYPGERAVVTGTIDIYPYHSHELRLALSEE